MKPPSVIQYDTRKVARWRMFFRVPIPVTTLSQDGGGAGESMPHIQEVQLICSCGQAHEDQAEQTLRNVLES